MEVVQEIVVAYLVVQVEEVELFRVLELQVLEQHVKVIQEVMQQEFVEVTQVVVEVEQELLEQLD